MGTGLSVLVVDDEPSVREFLRMILEPQGFSVELVDTAARAMELLRVGAFDIALIDKNLPDASGLDVARYVRDQDLTCETVIVTAYGNLQSAIDALRAGVAEYLEKPFSDVDSVYACLERVIRLHAIKQENRRLLAELQEKNRLLEELAVRDPLTRLYNHALFQEALEREIGRAEATDGQLSLLLIDIDNFRQINDALGHAVGDELLVAIAEILAGIGSQGGLRVRPHDIVARFGADRFAVVLTDTDKKTALERAELLRQRVAAFDFASRDLPRPTLSIGIASVPDDAADRLLLIERADVALYNAKRSGRNRAIAYEASLPDKAGGTRTSATEARRLEALDAAIVKCDFDFVYQPIVYAGTGEVFGFEALVRPRDKQFKNPLVLIRAAERAGRLRELGRSLREGSIPAIENLPAGTLLFINLHPHEVNDPEIVEPQPYLAPWTDRIVFEITEVAGITDYDRVKAVVQQLKRIGYRVALDDLGAGYSGLNSLAILQPDFVKLDMKLVHSMQRDTSARRLVKHIIEFAADERMTVIGEGVETEEQRDALVSLGCPLLQGYLFARPQPLSAIIGD